MRATQKDFPGYSKRPLYPSSWQADIDKVREAKSNCIHTINRDYTKNPIEHSGRGTGVLVRLI